MNTAQFSRLKEIEVYECNKCKGEQAWDKRWIELSGDPECLHFFLTFIKKVSNEYIQSQTEHDIHSHS